MWSDILFLFGAIAVWYALMRFILPALGIPTCMTGACQYQPPKKKEMDSDGK